MRALLVTLTTCLLVLPAHAKYSGGSGTAQDPYQIATAADLIALGETPEDYDKHFLLTADIDLDPNLPGRKVFDKAVIAPEGAKPFAGIVNGNGHTISHLTIKGGGHLGLFGSVGAPARISNLGLEAVEVSGIGNYVGGLVGDNYNGAIISASYSCGSVSGTGYWVGGLVGCNAQLGSISLSHSTGSVSGTSSVGGLAGSNSDGSVIQCYSTGVVSGGSCVGGLVGSVSSSRRMATVTNCYSAGAVRGGSQVGGLVGLNCGAVTHSYSTGGVSGRESAGGLVGYNGGWRPIHAPGADLPHPAIVDYCFYDTESSGQAEGADVPGKTTAEMQMASTFLSATWDFVGETANGTEDIWWIREGLAYPRLAWECATGVPPRKAFAPYPLDGDIDAVRSPILRWTHGEPTLLHDIYVGDDARTVASATPGTPRVHRGRYLAEVTTYDPGTLQWGKTYYWRIDEVNEGDPNSPWKGSVWSFTTVDFIIVVVDNFESYTDAKGIEARIYGTWIDGWGPDPNVPTGNGTTSIVGNPYAEQVIVHDGTQSMPMDYDNVIEPWYAEAERTWDTEQDWTIDGADTLTVYFRGEPNNSPEELYVGIEDSAGRMAVVVHADAEAVLTTEWRKWHIALDDVRAAGVDVAAVKKMVIGVGDRTNPQPGGTGRVYIDDIRLTKRMP